MKSLTGEITSKQGENQLATWRRAVQPGERYRIELTRKSFSIGGRIDLDETTPHGATFLTQLQSMGWTEDRSYDPDVFQKRRNAERLRKQQEEQARKTEQDRIDAQVNKPLILNELKSRENAFYNDKTGAERDAMTWSELSEYHSQMVLKKNKISELMKLKGEEDTKANWDLEGAKTFAAIETEIAQEKAKLDTP